MKLPLAVEAGVADELRNWLALELEQLNFALSTNQFAHHVVTILLHEDLDIEDEPLSCGDDFLKDIFIMRQTKTKEKQKKAAVEFLRSAVCSGNHTDADIQMVVEELMQKIEATKSKMQGHKTAKRSLLAPLAVNIDSPTKKIGGKTGASEELYNEAFPSLLGEDFLQKRPDGATTPNIAWNKSPGSGKENQKRKIRRKIGSRCTWLFRSPEEASACDIATEAAAVVLEDLSFSTKEAMEVWAPSHTSSTPFINPPGFCWTSAFSSSNLMSKPFSPSTVPLNSVHRSLDRDLAVKITSPVIVGDISNTSYPACPHVSVLNNWEEFGFCPISHKKKWEAKNQRTKQQKHGTYMSADSEVKFYFFPNGDVEEPQKINKDNHGYDFPKFDEEIEGLISFPTHYGSYWQDLISEGTISLYPPFDAEQGKDHCLRLSAQSNQANDCICDTVLTPTGEVHDFRQKPVKERKGFDVRKINGYCFESQNDLEDQDGPRICNEEDFDIVISKCMSNAAISESDIEADSSMLRLSAELLLAQDEKDNVFLKAIELSSQDHVDWDSPWHSTEWNDINQDILAGLMGTKKEEGNPYLPPQLVSCVKSEHSQFLQSAFVNAYFSSPHVNVYSQVWKPVSTHQRTCFLHNLHEHQFIRSKIWPVELVKGTTCCNWLENNCKLGLLCPFSHPSL